LIDMPLAHGPLSRLARVRRLEAAGFRAWPASQVVYDGTWLIRLTPGHPAKRLNSVNPLDPGDTAGLPERIERARRLFEAAGRTLTFRVSPLAGTTLQSCLDDQGWSRFDESIVMNMELAKAALDGAIDQIPLRDVGRFIRAATRVRLLDEAVAGGLAEVISAIEPEKGLFVAGANADPLAAAICVHDRDLAGLFEVATREEERGKGHGRRLVLSALKWARSRGARTAWLQVEADNEPAIHLYRTLGFTEAYRYHYRRPPEA